MRQQRDIRRGLRYLLFILSHMMWTDLIFIHLISDTVIYPPLSMVSLTCRDNLYQRKSHVENK